VRTPNTQCLLCGKPLYRRPHEIERFRYAACMACRSEAQKVAGITERQHSGLSLGREKGTNHRTGYSHREESKRKVAAANKAFWAANPEKAKKRGAKTRGPLHYRWKGGIARLNQSIRRMSENRKWMDAIKLRDQKCVYCGSMDNLESHHNPPLASLVKSLGIKSRDDARAHSDVLWSLAAGVALCSNCHDAAHGRHQRPPAARQNPPRSCVRCGNQFVIRPSLLKGRGGQCCSRACADAMRSLRQRGSDNPNWKGGNANR